MPAALAPEPNDLPKLDLPRAALRAEFLRDAAHAFVDLALRLASNVAEAAELQSTITAEDIDAKVALCRAFETVGAGFRRAVLLADRLNHPTPTTPTRDRAPTLRVVSKDEPAPETDRLDADREDRLNRPEPPEAIEGATQPTPALVDAMLRDLRQGLEATRHPALRPDPNPTAKVLTEEDLLAEQNARTTISPNEPFPSHSRPSPFGRGLGEGQATNPTPDTNNAPNRPGPS